MSEWDTVKRDEAGTLRRGNPVKKGHSERGTRILSRGCGIYSETGYHLVMIEGNPTSFEFTPNDFGIYACKNVKQKKKKRKKKKRRRHVREAARRGLRLLRGNILVPLTRQDH